MPNPRPPSNPFPKGPADEVGRPRGGRPPARKLSLDEELKLLTERAERSPAEILWDIARGKHQIVPPAQLAALRMVFERLEGRPRIAREKHDHQPRAWSVMIGPGDQLPAPSEPEQEEDRDPPEESYEDERPDLDPFEDPEPYDPPRDVEAEIVEAVTTKADPPAAELAPTFEPEDLEEMDGHLGATFGDWADLED